MWVRFDDMLATVLARSADRPMDRVAQWRQLLDLLAQRRPGADPVLARKALGRLQQLRADVPVLVRTETARAFAGRPVPAPLVVFLAADVPPVAGALLGQVRLSSADWLAVLPRLSPTGRGFLRHRRDLGHEVEAALAGFGAADLALTGEVAPPGPPEIPSSAHPDEEAVAAPAPGLAPGGGEGQIRAIISRIEKFRERRDGPPSPPEHLVHSFRFETGADGMIRWTDGEPRGALIGLHIFSMMGAQADAVLLHRSAFRDRRLHIPGRSPVAGAWLLSAVPVFSPAEGRFLGFRGTALRDTAADGAGEGGRLGIGADSLRQLVHELRTPLNAIGGFGEMIRHQMRGPVSAAYRQRAELIVELAGRLLAAVDDLDVAARLESDRLDLQKREVDLATMLDALCSHYQQKGARDSFSLERGHGVAVPAVAGDPAAIRRIADRVLAAVTALAAGGEVIAVELAQVNATEVEMAIDRPQRLAGQDADALFEPSFVMDGGPVEGPPLGLGFSLFLVRRLARAMGGGFAIDADRFRLRLPVASVAPRAEAV